MALFTAVILVLRHTMTPAHAYEYRTLLKKWVDGLPSVHPHTRSHAMRPNIHIAFHIHDFLLLFGPVISWWCFPFERVIGFLQKINTNDHIGGQLESTLSKAFMRGASLRRWLRRPDCPKVIQELKSLFERTFPSYNAPSDSTPRETDGTRAHYKRNGVNFSRASTHLGNSLVLYYPPNSATAIPGSIESILTLRGEVSFIIRRQAPLPAGMRNLFLRYYPYFPAQTYSSDMQDIKDTVSVDDMQAPLVPPIWVPPRVGDGPGWFYKHVIIAADQPIPVAHRILVKLGSTKNLRRRMREHQRHCRGQVQRWIFAYFIPQRYRFERIIHLYYKIHRRTWLGPRKCEFCASHHREHFDLVHSGGILGMQKVIEAYILQQRWPIRRIYL
ncbi:hypothetical protein C8F01DRAFT_1362285 [Mycena amicta]|nr:hypothetical protein C8F01DRAFT_1362285 [Mycena amicta]